MSVCLECKEDFNPNSNRQVYCKPCAEIRYAFIKTPLKKLHSNKKWRDNNITHYRNQQSVYHRKRAIYYKIKVFDLIGSICKNCSCSELMCLQIDHINDDGAHDRRRIRSGSVAYYKFLLSLPDIKSKVQPLCANCNWIKRGIKEEIDYLSKRGIPPV